MTTLTQLKYILAVEHYKNFSKAAYKCHVSQPSLSSQIHKIEKELDVIIFDRSKKPIKVTEKGEKIIEQAKIIILESKKLSDIKNDTGTLTGKFHLAVIHSLAPYIIPLFIESFSRKYPAIDLKISEYKTDEIIERLYDDKIDAGLVVTPLFDKKIIEKNIFYENFYVYASDNHKLYNKSILAESDLDTESLWLLEEGHCFRDQVIKVCSLNEKNNVLKNINFQSGNLETLINLIRRGKGYTLLPELATLNLTDKEKKNNLKSFLSPIPTREVSLIHNLRYINKRIIEALEKEISKSLPKQFNKTKNKNIDIINIK